MLRIRISPVKVLLFFYCGIWVNFNFDRVTCIIHIISEVEDPSFNNESDFDLIENIVDGQGKHHLIGTWYEYGVGKNIISNTTKTKIISVNHQADIDVTFDVRFEYGPFEEKPGVFGGGMYSINEWLINQSDKYWMWLSFASDHEDFKGSYLKDIHASLILNELGQVNVTINPRTDGNYKVEIFNGDNLIDNLEDLKWNWMSRKSEVVKVNANDDYTFTFNVTPNTNFEDFSFWIYKESWIPGIFFIQEQVVEPLYANKPINVKAGNTEVYSQKSTAAFRRAMPVTFSEAGTIQSISIFHNGGKGNVLLGVYADQGGSPASLLGVTASTIINSNEGWQTVPLTSPVAVTSTQKVWLSWVFQNSVGVRYASGAPGRMQSTETWSAGMPATFGTATFGNNKFSVYCTYIPEVAVTATLGNTEVFGTASAVAYRRAMPVTFGEAGTVQSISVYHNGGKGNVLLGVYADQAGSPASLLGVTAATIINSTSGWQTVPLTSPVAVTSGQKVWLSWVFQNSIGVRYASGAPGRMQSTETWSAGMPLTFGFATFGNNKFSVYCTYIPSGTKSAEVVSPHLEASEMNVYPNPFSDKNNFEFVSSNDAHALLEIYNLLGQSIVRLMDQQVKGGVMNRVEYEPTQIISGMYIYKLNLDGKTTVGKVIYKK